MEGLFKSTSASFAFTASNILVDSNKGAIEFELKIGNSVYDGIDIIEWTGGKMCAIRAYLSKKL